MDAAAVVTRRRSAWRAPVLVAALAFAVRMALIVRTPGGLTGLMGYDPGVYYAGGDALAGGRLPYRDFMFLHPPGVLLATAPFALLGRLTTDEVGFIAAVLGFMAIGAGNAGLVVVTGRRFGLPERAAITGGLAYAVWFGAVGTEVTVHLEPLGTLAFVGCLICVAPLASGGTARGFPLVGGVFAALACMVKIWWSVPLLVVLVWLGLRSRRWRVVGRFALGAGCGLVAVGGPFFAAAPAAMFRMVVVDQLSRHRGLSVVQRAVEITHLRRPFGSHVTALHVTAIAVAVGCVLVAIMAWRSRVRLPLALLVAQAIVLATAPSFFGFYADYVAASAALVVATAVVSPRITARVTGGILVAAAAIGTAYSIAIGLTLTGSKPFPARQLEAGVAGAQCVMSDSPGALIQIDALSRGLAAGCPNWIDITAPTHDFDKQGVDRQDNARWQTSALHYLRSGEAVVLARRATGLATATRHQLAADCVLAAAGKYRAYRTSNHPRPALSRAACRSSLPALDRARADPH